MNAYHHSPSSGDHLALKAILDKVRDRYSSPIVDTNVQRHSNSCVWCQQRSTPHRPLTSPVGHRPVERSCQRVAVDLVEKKPVSEGNRYILSVIDHPTKFVPPRTRRLQFVGVPTT